MKALLFAYGTLNDPAKQQELFGRRVEGTTDALDGYTTTEIHEEGVMYRVAIPKEGACIEGRIFRASEKDFAAADAWEGDAYRRERLVLRSGVVAWVYVKKQGMKAFIATKVDSEAAQERGARVREVLEATGFSVFLPKKRPGATAVEILESNEREVDVADVVICVFDGAGAGVGMELGRAAALKKDIVGFRTPESVADEYLGKMLEGFWQRLPADRKTEDLARLETVLTELKAKGHFLRDENDGR